MKNVKNKLREYPFNRYIDLKSHYKTLTYEGLDYVKGKQYHVLQVVYDDGTEESLYLDVKTYLIGLAKTGPLTMHLSDYREIDGVQIAFSWVADVETIDAFFTIKVKEVKHGVKIDNAIFAVPTD